LTTAFLWVDSTVKVVGTVVAGRRRLAASAIWRAYNAKAEIKSHSSGNAQKATEGEKSESQNFSWGGYSVHALSATFEHFGEPVKPCHKRIHKTPFRSSTGPTRQRRALRQR